MSGRAAVLTLENNPPTQRIPKKSDMFMFFMRKPCPPSSLRPHVFAFGHEQPKQKTPNFVNVSCFPPSHPRTGHERSNKTNFVNLMFLVFGHDQPNKNKPNFVYLMFLVFPTGPKRSVTKWQVASSYNRMCFRLQFECLTLFAASSQSPTHPRSN